MRTPAARAWLVLALLLTACAGSSQTRYRALEQELRRPASAGGEVSSRDADPFPGATVLERQALIAEVLARNPSVEAARQAFASVLARHARAEALDDPMLEYSLAPLSIGSDLPFGQTIKLSQRLPWPGKLALAGEVELAEAETARDAYETTRQRLSLLASLLFDRYFATTRSLARNDEHRQLVTDVLAVAQAQYQAGGAAQADVLAAEIELAHIEHDAVMLGAQRAVLVAQLNELLHRRPELPLPPPPTEVEAAALDLASSASLQEEALHNRPELAGQRSLIRGRQSALELAERQSYPDFGVMAQYSSMWMETEHQWMVGLSMNLPLQLGRRDGDERAAAASLAGARSELLGIEDAIRSEVEQARLRALEAEHVIALYRDRILPTARARIDAARIAYETGRGGFQGFLEAERSLRTLELQHEEALADLGRRRAELARALGRSHGQSSGAEGDDGSR